MREAASPVTTCPRCRRSTATPFESGGVCLRCAGERVLAAGSGDSAGFDPPLPRDAGRGGPDRIGPYEIIDELGRGGMGRVYAARQTRLGRIVALKVIPSGSATTELELRFLREAQTVARLHHPHIVAIHDSGRADGHVYFSMDYVEDGDLARRLRERPFAPRAAAALLQKTASALAHAHAAGVLHRDLKPSNILLDADEPRVADFGLAAQLEPGAGLTPAGEVLGTPHYVAPEALGGGGAALTAAADLYALGIVLFEMLTGRTPFAGASPAELSGLLATAEPPSPRLLAPAVPRDLETICLKCLERDPVRRYAGAAALAEDLRRFLAGESIAARPVSAMGHFIRWCRRRPALALVWLLVCALATGSSLAAAKIARERARTADALAQARLAEAGARERLREARLAEARAVRRTAEPGRRAQALAALAEAAHVHPGADLRAEAASALMLTDVHPEETWDLRIGSPGQIAFDPSGRLAAFEPRDGSGLLRDPAFLRRWGEATPLLQLERQPAPPVGPLRFSRDGSMLMLRFRDETLRVWRTTESRPFLTIGARPLPGRAQLVEDLNDDYDFSPDGRLLVLGLPGRGLSLHRIADGAEVARWEEGDCFTTVRFSPDGKHVAATGSATTLALNRVWILSADTWTPAQILTLPNPSTKVAWTSDGLLLAVGLLDNTIAVYDSRDGRLLQKQPTGERGVVALAIVGGDALLAARSSSPLIHLTGFATGEPVVAINEVSPGLLSATSAVDTFVTASLEGVATRWRVDRPAGFSVIPAPRVDGYHFNSTECGFDVTPDGRWFAVALGRYTQIRDARTGRLAFELDTGVARGFDVAAVALGPGGDTLLRCSQLTGLQRYRFNATEAREVVVGPAEMLDPEPGFVMTDHTIDGRRLVLVNLSTGEIETLAVDAVGIHRLARWKTPGAYMGALSPDGTQVLVNCDGAGPDAARQRLRVHRAADGGVVAELPGPAFGEAAWSRDGRTALTSNDQKTSTLWDTATWRPKATLTGASGGNITTFALAGSGDYAAITRDERLHLVSTRDGAELVSFDVPVSSGLAVSMRFLPDGKRFAVLWRDGRIDLFDPGALRAALAPLGLAW